MRYELNNSHLSDGVSRRAIGVTLAGLGIGTIFWGILFYMLAG